MSIGFNPEDPKSKLAGRKILAKKAGQNLTVFAPYFVDATPETFQADYNRFVERFPAEAVAINDFKPDGVGPGELVVWFIFNNIQLGGKNSPIDLMKDGAPFAEMKGGAYDVANHALKGFKITKDSDPAVDLIRRDFQEFNDTYQKIVGSNLTGWEPGNILTSTLNIWSQIDLRRESRHYAGLPRSGIPVIIALNGDILYEDKIISNDGARTFGKDIQRFRSSPVEIAVNNDIATLEKIVNRWRQMAYSNYLRGKQLALVNSKSLGMLYFGEVTADMIGLVRIGRNQPEARIYLPKETK